MKRFLSWMGIIVAVLILVVFAAATILTRKFDQSYNRTFDIEVTSISIPDDSASIAKGSQLAGLCTGCHGEQLEGKAMIDDPSLATIYAPNLTPGQGGVGSNYSIEDWVRAVRHGIGVDNTALFVMPSQEYNHLSAEDLGNLIAYLQDLSPVDNETGEHTITTKAKVLASLGTFGTVFSAEHIDHTAPFALAPEVAASVEYGAYMVDVAGCRTCHGQGLNGGKDPNPEAPVGPNLTPGGRIANWSEDQFLEIFKTGITPEGKELSTLYMPWQAYGQMDETALQAIYVYLKSLDPAESAVKEAS